MKGVFHARALEENLFFSVMVGKTSPEMLAYKTVKMNMRNKYICLDIYKENDGCCLSYHRC